MGFLLFIFREGLLNKNVDKKLKAEILLNLLGDKASNIITYMDDKKLNDYEEVKNIVLREFEPTPLKCLENFKKTTRQTSETFVQFATRLTNSWEYYLKLRKVSDFATLKELIISDRIFQTLDKDCGTHISIRQSSEWFKPLELGKEVDLYYTSRGKNFIENTDNYYKNPKIKNVSKVFLSDVKNMKCILCNRNHFLYKCSNYNKLSVDERVNFVKSKHLCFNCLSFHLVNQCKSKYSCFICKKRHHISLHFPLESRSNDKRSRQ